MIWLIEVRGPIVGCERVVNCTDADRIPSKRVLQGKHTFINLCIYGKKHKYISLCTPEVENIILSVGIREGIKENVSFVQEIYYTHDDYN